MNLIEYMSSISYLLFFANINGSASIQNRFDIYAVGCGTDLTDFEIQYFYCVSQVLLSYRRTHGKLTDNF
jgi:hypothetical protein